MGDGAEAASWQSAAGCLRDLQNDLRRDRACELRGLTDQAVRRLLADVGLTVTDLSVQGTKAGVVIHDEQGRPVELGMLALVGATPEPEVDIVVAAGRAARVLIDTSAEVDVLVVGHRGRGGFAGLLLGSVGQRCVLHARCPVIVVRPTPG